MRHGKDSSAAQRAVDQVSVGDRLMAGRTRVQVSVDCHQSQTVYNVRSPDGAPKRLQAVTRVYNNHAQTMYNVRSIINADFLCACTMNSCMHERAIEV